MENFIDIGTQLHLLIFGWGSVGLLTVAALLVVACIRWDSAGSAIGAVGAGIMGAFFLVLWAVSLVPFDAKYHQLYRVTGEVTGVSNVLTEDGGDLTRTPVLSIDTVDRDITMSDPRAVNLQGQTVDLTCSIEWVYQGADRYNCKIYRIH